MRVLVPLRARKPQDGRLYSRAAGGPARRALKSVLHLYDDGVCLTSAIIALALWMCRQYFCTFFSGADAMLPPGLWEPLRPAVRKGGRASWTRRWPLPGAASRSRRCCAPPMGLSGPMTAGELMKAAGLEKADTQLKALAAAGALASPSRRPRSRARRTVRMLSLAMPPDQAEKPARRRRAGRTGGRALSRTLAQAGSLARAGALVT